MMKGFTYGLVFFANIYLIGCAQAGDIKYESELLSFSGKVKCEIKVTVGDQEHVFTEKDIKQSLRDFTFTEPWITINFIQGEKHLTIVARIHPGDNHKIVIADAFSDFSPESTKGGYTRFVKVFDQIEQSAEEIGEKSQNLELELEQKPKEDEILKSPGKILIKVTELKLDTFNLKPGKKTMEAHVQDKSSH